jgi:tetratricopeptide (TPR) repeat protein
MALLPEILVQKGLLLIQRNKHGEAVKAYLDAIQTMPTYVPAYSALSDYYCELGNVEEARDILSRGLEQVPGSKILKKRISEVESACKSEVR